MPALAECLTLTKADFIRARARGATYLAYRKAIQEVVSRQLAVWGDAGEPAERARRRAARPVERDLEGVLADLAGDFPLLAALVEQRAGGQRRLPAAGTGPVGPHAGLLAAHEPIAAQRTSPAGPEAEQDGEPPSAGEAAAPAEGEAAPAPPAVEATPSWAAWSSPPCG